MKINEIAKICVGQDGSIYAGFVFRFNECGHCTVYNLASLKKGDATVVCSFDLDGIETLAPHSNAVMFGNEFFDEKDEFPLLYTNIYNNYSKFEDRKCGVCAVYRIRRNGTDFTSNLVQTIKIGFAEDEDLWASEGKKDVRPYGNFVVDRENCTYYGFTMRDAANSTRYFSFELPSLSDGKEVVLEKSHIKEYFDCEYHRYIQGACCHDGKIYSVEGFTNDNTNVPALRIIDPKEKKQLQYIPFFDFGMTIEPEFIEFYEDVCYYCDNSGNFYIIEF